MNEKRTLYVPHGLKTRVEYFSGFGKPEFRKSVALVFGCNAVNLLMFLFLANQMVAIAVLLASIAASVMLFSKDSSNVSVAEQFTFMLHFLQSQKCYRYKWKGLQWNEIENEPPTVGGALHAMRDNSMLRGNAAVQPRAATGGRNYARNRARTQGQPAGGRAGGAGNGGRV